MAKSLSADTRSAAVRLDATEFSELVRSTLTSARGISPAGTAIWLTLGALRIVLRQGPMGFSGMRADLLAGLATVVIAGAAAAWFAHSFLLPKSGYRCSAGRVLGIYLFVLAIIGIAQVALTRLGIDVGFIPLRLITGLLALYLIACILEFLQRYRDGIRRLQQEEFALVQLRFDTVAQLRQLRSTIAAGARAQIEQPAAEVLDTLAVVRRRSGVSAHDLRQASGAIHDRLIAPIRDFSYQVQAAPSSEPEPLKASGGATGPNSRFLSWREVAVAIPVARPFRPVPVGVSVIFLTLENVFYFAANIWVGLCASAIFAIFLLICLALADRYLTPVLRRRSPPIAWFWFFVTTCLIGLGLAGVFAAFAWLGGLPHPAAAFAGLPLAVVLILTWSVISAVVAKVADTELHLRRAIESTQAETFALEREKQLNRRVLAHALHGEVQSMLTAAAFRLDLTAEQLVEDQPTDLQVDTAVDEAMELIEQSMVTIDSIVAASTAVSPNDRGLVDRLSDLIAAWAPIAQIQIQLAPATAAILDSRVNDASLTPVVIDLVREGILNATRHAAATHIWISIGTADSVCRLTIENDGFDPPTQIRPGLGQQLLDQLHCQWQLKARDPSGAVLRVELPLLRMESSPSEPY